MATATSTLIKQPSKTHQLLKLSPISVSITDTPQTSTSATLRSLYTRAARAFVLRDTETTSSLLHSAFSILKPPQSHPDALSDDRKKWDILRITFESTVYCSPPSSSNQLPESIRHLLTEAPQALVSSMYTRSLLLFSPSSEGKKSAMGASYLPSQVVTTLVYCSLKLGVPDLGRVVIEDWLARREPYDSSSGRNRANIPEDGYDTVLKLYCLHILPKLDQWDYIKEFLEYESELPVQRREELKTSLQNLYTQAMASKELSKPALSSSLLATSGSSSPRSYSPSSSSSSSVSTTSTHTVVPATPRGRSIIGVSSMSSRRSPSDASSTSNSTAIPPASVPNGHQPHTPQSTPSRPTNHDRSRSESQTNSSKSSVYSNFPRTRLAPELSRSEPPTTLALIKASLNPYLTRSRLPSLLFIFILIPLISFVLRIRRRMRLAALGPLSSRPRPLAMGAASAAGVSNADFVRRRLVDSGGESGLVQRAWNQVVRVVSDTVKMGGSGLV